MRRQAPRVHHNLRRGMQPGHQCGYSLYVFRRRGRLRSLQKLVNESGMQLARAKFRVLQNLPEEADVSADTAHVVFAQRPERARRVVRRVSAHTASLANSGS